MSGRGAYHGRGGGRGGGAGRGKGYTGHKTAPQVGLEKELGRNIFDYGGKGAADLMKTSWEKVCQFAGKTYGETIATEMRTETRTTMTPPQYDQAILTREQQRATIVTQSLTDLQTARRATLTAMQAEADRDLVAEQVLQNEIAMGEFKLTQPVEMELTREEKMEHQLALKSYGYKKDALEKHRGQAYLLVLGQCTKMLVVECIRIPIGIPSRLPMTHCSYTPLSRRPFKAKLKTNMPTVLFTTSSQVF